ncbi:hypothetical protein CEXT_644181 [Caerostris extrusa]|uniref:Uncharacterized protein n=1 Tax=Caerostris extrusa TaxID=172846 RepID=A0AAV4TXQ5_CAEEX|nr:hypothetical protein CEXT_644181 [Caerostris extrusa]
MGERSGNTDGLDTWIIASGEISQFLADACGVRSNVNLLPCALSEKRIILPITAVSAIIMPNMDQGSMESRKKYKMSEAHGVEKGVKKPIDVEVKKPIDVEVKKPIDVEVKEAY